MQEDRWRQVDKIFHDLIEQTPEQRASFLERLCVDDPSLKKEVEELIQAFERSGTFLDSSAPVSISGSLVGRTLGSFEVKALIGSGGMGRVYRAWDSQLKREVAIKILPEEFSRNVDRLRRFQREAEVLASLNHPNIANIYHLEEQNGSRYLVLELVEGETLAERIARGPIPIDEALPIAQQIAEALEAAHDKGIIHRDLKPANIKIMPGDNVKVLDFGLAKAREGAASSPTLSNSAMKISGTTGGMILGTAAYMSPEQARGREADQRSDIFSFGCVLYEMLTGSQAFQGESVSDVLASVVKAEPDFNRLPKNINPRLHELIRRCLVKSPRDRWYAIGDVRVELERLLADPVELVSPSVAVSYAFRRFRFITAALAVGLITALVLATVYLSRNPEEKTTIRVEMATPGIQPGRPAISPDGQYSAYAARVDGKSAIWIRPIGEFQARPLVGTENGSSPFWSPDSRHLAFFAGGKLKKIGIAGGSPTTLADTGTTGLALGGTWNLDGIILFCFPQFWPGLLSISESGGAVTPVRSTHRDGFQEISPQFLPDSRHFLYASTSGPFAKAELYVGSLDGETPVHLLNYAGNDSSARYAAPGYLLFTSEGTLMAQRFDENRLTLGPVEPVAIAERAGGLLFSVSAQQTLVYYSIETLPDTQRVVWIDRNGKLGPLVEMPGIFQSLRLSPDGLRLALDQTIEGNRDVWVIDVDRGIRNRLTFDPAADGKPKWSPDGAQIVFSSSRLGSPRMFIRSSSNIGTEQPLSSDTPSIMWDDPEDWSPDGKYIVFSRETGTAPSSIWVKPMFGDGKPFPIVQSKPFMPRYPRVSPNSRWLAYTTGESGMPQIVVQTFPDPTLRKITVTAGGGLYPTWRHDGRELYYVAIDGKLMAVSVKEDGDRLDFGTSTVLFQAPIKVPSTSTVFNYDVSPDGNRFVFISNNNTNPANPNDSDKLSVVLNWTAALHKK